MPTDTSPTETVRRFSQAMQARDWDLAATFLDPQVTVWWPSTDEHFAGPDFLAMQRAYPEGWRITVTELIAEGSRVAGRIQVDKGPERFWCHGCWTVQDGRITDAVELWGTQGAEQPPRWRAEFTSPAPGRPDPTTP